MITWMQRHKKWLITTVWVSTIAFVGAGFVGWGSYDFGKSSGTVAIVGDREVPMTQLQNEYSNLYGQYAQMLGGEFNQEMAEKFNLQQQAMETVIQKNLLLSYADELGLGVTQKEIAKQLLKIPAFQKDGKFDKQTYIKVLGQNKTTPAEFENSLGNDILVQKVTRLFTPEIVEQEIQNISQLIFLEDKISVEIIDAQSIKATATQKELKAFYEENKNNYLSTDAYKIQLFKMPLQEKEFTQEELKQYHEDNKYDFTYDDGKLKSYEESKKEVAQALNAKNTKNDALRKYLALKKGEESFLETQTILESDMDFDATHIQMLKKAELQKVQKPFLHNNHYIIAKVVEKIEPQPLAFEEVKDTIKKAFLAQKQQKLLDAKAQNTLENFSGKSVGFVGRESVDAIPGLNQMEASNFLNELFTQTDKKGVIALKNKVVVYEILDSRLASESLDDTSMVKSTIIDIKQGEVLANLLDSLQNRYEVHSYMQGK